MTPRQRQVASARWSLRLVLSRLQTRTALLSLASCLGFLVLVTLAVRAVTNDAPLGRALGFWGDYWLAGVAFLVVRLVAAPEGIHRGFRSVVGAGLPKLGASLAGVVAAFGLTAVMALVGFLAVVLLMPEGRHLFLAELSVGAPLSLAAAAAYTFVLAGASIWGARGGGQWACFVLFITLGRGSGWLSVLIPNSHVRSLLGGGSVVGLSQRASFVTLVLLAALGALVLVRSVVKRQGGRLT